MVQEAGLLHRLARAAVLHNARLGLRLALRAFCQARVLGEEHVPPRGGLIVAANHTSVADPAVLQVFIPRFLTYMMTDKFYYVPVLHAFVRFWGVLVVKQQGLNKDALRAAGGVLARGGAIGIFPEGGISRDGLIHDAQPGTALLAERSGAPILPVGLDGVAQLLPPDTRRLQRSRITICVGNPIFPQGQSRNELAARITADIRDCAARARQGGPA
jgi:1-acyl-sn-glycerol-3-phosphate acyltransferase